MFVLGALPSRLAYVAKKKFKITTEMGRIQQHCQMLLGNSPAKMNMCLRSLGDLMAMG